jgi:sugar (pentulose or hexulose) kinase
MYDDNRAEGLFAELRSRAPESWKRLGAAFQPSWALAKIIWLQRNGMPARTHRIVHQTDVVSAAMTGHMVATDWSNALKSGYDLQGMRWPEETLLKLGVDCALLPRVVAPGQLLGVTSAAWQLKTQLPAGIPIVAGTTDGCAAQIGAGALKPGDWHTVLGTTLVFKGVGERPIEDESGVVYSHLSPDGKAWFPGGASNVGAGAISSLLPGRDLNALAAKSAHLWESVTPDSPICYPLLGTGERFPVARPDARGFVVTSGRRLNFDHSSGSGLSMVGGNRDRSDAMKMAAVLIGVSCVERLGFEVFSRLGAPSVERLTTSGGGSRSFLWNRLRSSMLNSSIHLMKSAEGSLGMAILAAWAIGVDTHEESLAAVSKRMNRGVEVIDPDPRLLGSVEEHFHRFRAALVEEGWV